MQTQKSITEKIEAAKRAGENTVRVTGSYEIFETILLPSDFCLILEDCYLRMADGVKTQMFRNAGYRLGEKNTPSDARTSATRTASICAWAVTISSSRISRASRRTTPLP